MLIIEFKGIRPQIAENVYIAPNATVIGDVTLAEDCSVWFGAVIRGDSGAIRFGRKVNIQDNAVIHVNGRHDTIVEDEVTIGHAAVLEGCHIGRGTLIGMNATILDGAIIGRNCVIAAGSVVREGSEIPDGMLVAGVPAVVKRQVPASIQTRLKNAPDSYKKYAEVYRTEASIIDTHTTSSEESATE